MQLLASDIRLLDLHRTCLVLIVTDSKHDCVEMSREQADIQINKETSGSLRTMKRRKLIERADNGALYLCWTERKKIKEEMNRKMQMFVMRQNNPCKIIVFTDNNHTNLNVDLPERIAKQ